MFDCQILMSYHKLINLCYVYFEVFDFELTDEEMDKLNKTGVKKRIFWAPA